MKTASLVYVGMLMTFLTLGILCILVMKSSYAETIRDNLDDSLIYSVKQFQRDRGLLEYTDADGSQQDVVKRSVTWDESDLDGFKKDFIGYLTSNLDQRIYALDVDIYGVDMEVGALSVEVTAHFRYPSGQTDTVSSYKTVILNKFIK